MLELTTILEISIFWACFGFVWVLQLVTPDGLFKGITAYSDAIGDTLTRIFFVCVPCLAGWGAMITVFILHISGLVQGSESIKGVSIIWVIVLVFWDILRCGIFAMTLGKLMQSFSERR